MRKLVISLLILCVTFLSGQFNTVSAQSNNYDRIDIYVQLNEDGSAHIKELWKAQLYDGTENYIVKDDLGKATIENFKVTENGQEYEFVEKWDLDASREEKAFKNGIIKTKNGVELSWGIGDYGEHEYLLEYTVTNMVKQLKDAQMLFWTFSTEGVNVPRSHISVEIEAPKSLNADDEKVWGFGYDGYIDFSNGKVFTDNDVRLTEDNHVTILLQFQDGTFAATDKINKKFSKIQKQAFKGSDYSTGIQLFLSKVWGFIKGAFSIIIFGFIFVLLFIFNKGRSGAGGDLNVGHPRKFRRQYKEEYYRDYPYEGNLLHAYYISYLMGVSNFNTILTALLLKWINEDNIATFESTSGMLNRKTQVIQFLKSDIDASTYESELFHMLRRTADKEGKVTDRRLAKWAESNYQRLRTWEKNVMKESTRMLEAQGLVNEYEKKILFFTQLHYELTQEGKDVETNIYKYVNYLHDFSLLNERDAINVKLWDDIMVWAAYLNLTDVVRKQFAKLYPKYLEETKLKEDTVRRSALIAHSVERSRRKKEREEQERRSSGGGGSTSIGGGGGSSGGGSGGGTR